MPVADRLLSMLELTAGPKAAMEPRASTMKMTHPMPSAPAHTAFISPVTGGGVEVGVQLWWWVTTRVHDVHHALPA